MELLMVNLREEVKSELKRSIEGFKDEKVFLDSFEVGVEFRGKEYLSNFMWDRDFGFVVKVDVSCVGKIEFVFFVDELFEVVSKYEFFGRFMEYLERYEIGNLVNMIDRFYYESGYKCDDFGIEEDFEDYVFNIGNVMNNLE